MKEKKSYYSSSRYNRGLVFFEILFKLIISCIARFLFTCNYEINRFFCKYISFETFKKLHTNSVFWRFISRLRLSQNEIHKLNGVDRSSRLQTFLKIDALKRITIFTGKHLCWSLFLNKIVGLRFSTL